MRRCLWYFVLSKGVLINKECTRASSAFIRNRTEHVEVGRYIVGEFKSYSDYI